MSRRKRILGAHMLGVSSKNLPVDLFQHHADGIGCWPVSALTAAPRLRCRAAHEERQVGMQFPIVKPVLYDIDGQGYDVGPGELPRYPAGQTSLRAIALAPCAVRHRLDTPAGRCPSGLTRRARE